ncbi:MAG: 2-oxo acid dehydrogenase subunit E2, partial [Pseudomonadota bacterium]|nr:2-oxo acid dehydrogenase subunit E2 [Pseudomonadota bacterium]
MQVEVKIPQLSESVSEATLVAWRKKAGEAVKRDENLIDVETDKVVIELPAPVDGVLAKIVKKDGESVTSGEVIAVIDTTATATAKPVEKEAVVPAPDKDARGQAPAGTQSSKPASPAAAKIAAEKGVDTATVPGSGRDGRVTKADVMDVPPAKAGAQTAAEAPRLDSRLRGNDVPAGSRSEQRVPMSRLRQRVAERLVQSQATAAILTTFNEVNMAPVMELRNRYKEKFEKDHGVKLGFMSFFVKAVVHALRKYPVVNASIDGTDIVYHGYFDIGIAVGSERGLVVPILRNADQMSIAQVEQAIADFGRRAKD